MAYQSGLKAPELLPVFTVWNSCRLVLTAAADPVKPDDQTTAGTT